MSESLDVMCMPVEGWLMGTAFDCFFAMHQQETPARMRREVLVLAGWLASQVQAGFLQRASTCWGRAKPTTVKPARGARCDKRLAPSLRDHAPATPSPATSLDLTHNPIGI